MVLTPSSTSSAIAGGGFWALMWSILFHASHLPYIGRFIPRDKILDYINDHKVNSILITEVVNISTHSGILGVTFALGGTIVNLTVILILFPVRALLTRRSRRVKFNKAAGVAV